MITTLDEAIQHCEEVANKQFSEGCSECGNEHIILAEWLKELKMFRHLSSIISYNKHISQVCDIRTSELLNLLCNSEISSEEIRIKSEIISNDLIKAELNVTKAISSIMILNNSVKKNEK